ncbi:MAG: sugar ABC transporter ATP-binding protein [Myxococcales bacterium]|nr:sugar ABC transporter ATP-binding protein [Myxococcales bacterium]
MFSSAKPSGEVVLEAKNVSKFFPGVKALDQVSITLRSGRLTALLGENGAGKSTLMNIIAGVLPMDEGELQLAGARVHFSNPREAREAGVSMIFQEFNLFADLSVAENIFLGREPIDRWGFVDFATMNRHTSALLSELDLAVEPTTTVDHLRVGQQQIVEIAKAISSNARVLIMDEPTSAITEHEIGVLFGLVKKLKAQGVAIAYITHKLEELIHIGDDAVVMRDGKMIQAAPLQDLSRDEIVEMMVGRSVKGRRRPNRVSVGSEVLRAEGVSLRHPERHGDFLLKDINFHVCRGEVLGLFGLMGAGRTELLETMFGLHAARASGMVFVRGEHAKIHSPLEAIRHGLALAPEDRKREGLVLGMSVCENTSLACLSRFERAGFLNESAEREMVAASVARFRVKTPSIQQTIRNLSGGNQQKVILAKWLETNPEVLLLDEPTRGIDANAKDEIYALIHELSQSGLAVIVVSSEIPEILALADRVMVMCEGRKTAEFNRETVNEQVMMAAALPLSRGPK